MKRRITLGVVFTVLLVFLLVCGETVAIAFSLPMETGGGGGLTHARTEAEVRDDHYEAIRVNHQVDLDTVDLPQDTGEVYVSLTNRDEEERYLATMYRLSNEGKHQYTFVGDLSGEMYQVKNDWYLMPNGYLFNLDSHGITRQHMRDFAMTGEVLTISWPSQGPEFSFYQQPLLHLAAKLRVWYQESCSE